MLIVFASCSPIPSFTCFSSCFRRPCQSIRNRSYRSICGVSSHFPTFTLLRRASDRHPSAESSGFCLPHRFCQAEIHDTTRDALRGSCIFPVHSRTHTALFLRPSSGSEESRRPLPAALSYRQAAAQNFFPVTVVRRHISQGSSTMDVPIFSQQA